MDNKHARVCFNEILDNRDKICVMVIVAQILMKKGFKIKIRLFTDKINHWFEPENNFDEIRLVQFIEEFGRRIGLARGIVIILERMRVKRIKVVQGGLQE